VPEGILPGGLNVRRRAFNMHQNLIGLSNYSDPQTWLEQIRLTEVKFRQILKWVLFCLISKKSMPLWEEL
jgi:L-serine dehydratase